ncbi:MAG: hypothetical protein ACREL1_09235, partial [bacterium]
VFCGSGWLGSASKIGLRILADDKLGWGDSRAKKNLGGLFDFLLIHERLRSWGRGEIQNIFD